MTKIDKMDKLHLQSESEIEMSESAEKVETQADQVDDKMNEVTDDQEFPSVRHRTFSMMGKQFELDKIADTFRGLENLASVIVKLIDKEMSFETVKAKHTIWMGKYESYLERNNYIMSKLPPEDQEQYVVTFEERESSLSKFKNKIQEYFKVQMQQKENDRRSQRSISRHSSSQLTRSHKSSSQLTHSHKSGSSHYSSNISYKKMKEEQKMAELEAKIRFFESRQELEIAKMKLKLQEEKLQLKTELEISDARSKVLTKYENFEDKLEENIFYINAFCQVQ